MAIPDSAAMRKRADIEATTRTPHREILDRLHEATNTLEAIVGDARAVLGKRAEVPAVGAKLRGSDLAYFLSDLRRIRDRVFGRRAVDDSSWGMILHLVKAESDGVTVTALNLYASTAISRTLANQKLDGLVKAGLAIRERDALDRRRLTISLTDRARHLFASVSEQATANERRTFGELLR